MENLSFFTRELLPYYIVLHSANGLIKIDVKKENLKHLFGVGHSCLKLNKIRPLKFFDELSNGKYNLFDLIEYNRFKLGKLFYQEKLILKKNLFFKSIFESLLNSPQIYIYAKGTSNGKFNTDYLHFKLENGNGIYLGFVIDKKTGLYYFNSILVESECPKKYLNGKQVKITKIERILKEKSFFDDTSSLETYQEIYPLKKMINVLKILEPQTV